MQSHCNCNNNNNNDNDRIISTNTILSSSSSSCCSKHTPFTHTSKTMEEVWKDINPSATTNHRDATVKGYRGFILQDFLAKPFSSNDVTPTTTVCGSSPRYGSTPSPPQQPPMLLNLNSGPDQLNFLTEDPTRNVCPLDVPFDQVLASANSSSGLLGHGIGGMRMLPATDRNGGDRRHKRMIKNRESAARSRARKQAYTNELENEVERLKEENAMLKRQQQQLQVATAAQTTKKGGLQRTSTAPF
ncbi:bZIP transcription factor 27-like [Rutidosis leptorrhynchoides]|uniref:bZIP transcription factor 27-like n=1 Tax=Rutidosis leptorrhynchoides TaxID=125765 RepID=UPI003A98DE0B